MFATKYLDFAIQNIRIKMNIQAYLA